MSRASLVWYLTLTESTIIYHLAQDCFFALEIFIDTSTYSCVVDIKKVVYEFVSYILFETRRTHMILHPNCQQSTWFISNLQFLKGTALWTKTRNQKRAVYANSTSTVVAQWNFLHWLDSLQQKKRKREQTERLSCLIKNKNLVRNGSINTPEDLNDWQHIDGLARWRCWANTNLFHPPHFPPPSPLC